MPALRMMGSPIKMKHAQVIVTLEESVKVTSDVLGEELISLMAGSDDQSKNVPIKLCFPRGAQNAAERLSAPQLCFLSFRAVWTGEYKELLRWNYSHCSW